MLGTVRFWWEPGKGIVSINRGNAVETTPRHQKFRLSASQLTDEGVGRSAFVEPDFTMRQEPHKILAAAVVHSIGKLEQ